MKENIEWSNLWCSNCNDSKPRILLIGDSICEGYYEYVNEALCKDYNVDRLATSRTISTDYYKAQLRMVLGDNRYALISFNNGLHGIDLPCSEYRKAVGECLDMMTDSKVILLTSTPITKRGEKNVLDELNNVVTERNKAVFEIARERALETCDLYNFVVNKTDIRSDDGYHYTKEGYRDIAEKLVQSLRK